MVSLLFDVYRGPRYIFTFVSYLLTYKQMNDKDFSSYSKCICKTKTIFVSCIQHIKQMNLQGCYMLSLLGHAPPSLVFQASEPVLRSNSNSLQFIFTFVISLEYLFDFVFSVLVLEPKQQPSNLQSF